MAFSQGRLARVELQNTSGTYVDISSYLRDSGLQRQLDTLDTTTFGATAKAFQVGLQDNRFSATGLYDPTFEQLITAVMDYNQATGTRGYKYYPQGNSAGSPVFTANIVIVSYSIRSSVSGMNELQFDAIVSGTVTRSTV